MLYWFCIRCTLCVFWMLYELLFEVKCWNAKLSKCFAQLFEACLKERINDRVYDAGGGVENIG